MSQESPHKVVHLGPIRCDELINRLNVLHYRDVPFMVRLRHRDHGNTIRVKARPLPVTDEYATATWVRDDGFPAVLAAYDVAAIILPGTRRTFEFMPERCWTDEGGVHFVIPKTAVEAKSRKHPRYDCSTLDVSVTLTQNALVFRGRLLEYSVAGIVVSLDTSDQLSLNWLNTSIAALLTIVKEGETAYAGTVTLASRGQGQYLLVPSLEPTPRYTPRQHRARRQQFIPSPDLIFCHPVTGRKHALKVRDLSSLGLGIEEHEATAVLVPGLLIRQAQLSFANSLCLPCLAQVVYTLAAETRGGAVRSGVTILHMELQDHLKLISLIQQAQDPHAYISNKVDPDDLFEFFFETGFLYPHKYVEIAGSRECFRRAYETLYERGADISRHFVYQSAGQILGHFATLRVYRQTWMNQHHAALNSRRAGLKVVRAISEFLNDSFKLNPTNIAYIIGYYRTANKFPQHYFGEYVKWVDNPSQTSLDSFSFLIEASRFGSDRRPLASDWILERATPADLTEFRWFYDKVSGGLLPDALDLVPDGYRDDSLALTFADSGLSRQRRVYVLRQWKSLKALIDVQNSDVGLNLSEITNATTVYVLDPAGCHPEVLRFAVHELAVRYNKMHQPLMFYPHTYLADHKIPSDKEYTLWALSIVHASESYMTWMNRYCR